MARIFSKSHQPQCGYCLHGKPCRSTDRVVCTKKGVVNRLDSCSRFRYDPIGRIPQPIPLVEKHEKSEFEL